MPGADLDVDLFLARAWKACRAGSVVIEDYAARRAYDELGWRFSEIIELLLTLERAHFVRNEARRHGPGLLWMFMPWRDHIGDIWVELAFSGERLLVVVSIHPTDGEGEP